LNWVIEEQPLEKIGQKVLTAREKGQLIFVTVQLMIIDSTQDNGHVKF